MTEAEKLIKIIKQWAVEREAIRGVILIGSHAQKKKADRLSDIHLCIFTTDHEEYRGQGKTLGEIAPVWLSAQRDKGYPIVWNVIYEPGIITEFFIYSIEAQQDFIQQLPPDWNPGYEVLIDKDKSLKKLHKASGKVRPPEIPGADAFQNNIQNFWLNALLVAKYLYRGELWQAKHYDWVTKQLLLQMMGWHALICGHQTNFTTYQGEHLKSWISSDIYTDIMTAFGRFYPADSWRALEMTYKSFSRLSSEVAASLEIDDIKNVEDKIIPMIEDLKTPNDQ